MSCEVLMSAQEKSYLTAREYLAIERQAKQKSEFVDGDIFLMAAVSGGYEYHYLTTSKINIQIQQEDIMDKKHHWETVYQQKQPNEVSWFQTHPEYSLDLIKHAGVTQEQAIIDVGGGASHLVDSLLDAGYRDVSVLDIAQAALQHAQARLASRAAQVTWLVSDVLAFAPPQSYALWHDRAVFHFLTNSEDRARYLEVVAAALQTRGHLIIATFAPDGPEQCSNLPVERYDADKLISTLGADFSLLETLSEAHQTPSAKIQHFLYFRLQKNH